MLGLADRMSLIKPSATMEITAKAKAMKAEGIDIIGFGAGEPDFDTPDFVKEAAITAIREGKTKYTNVAGIDELRDALVNYYEKVEGLHYGRNQTIFSVGGKHSLFNVFMAILSPGDEVVIPAPYWVSYPDMTLLAGGTPVILSAREEDGFRFTADELKAVVTDKTKAIVLNSPSNPSGAVYDEETLKAICQVAKEREIYVVADEIYKDVYYGAGKLRSLPFYDPEVLPYTLIVSGLAKNFSMTGWRIGWTVGDEKVIKAMSMIQGQSTSNPTSFAQYGALAAINEMAEGEIKHLEGWLTEFRARRDFLLSAFNDIEGMSCVKPEGAFYVYPNISGWYGKKWRGGEIKDSYDATKFLLEEARVAVVPGDPFGTPDNVRLSYALSMENVKKGTERIKEAVSGLT